MSSILSNTLDLDSLDLNDLAFWERVAAHFRERLGGGMVGIWHYLISTTPCADTLSHIDFFYINGHPNETCLRRESGERQVT